MFNDLTVTLVIAVGLLVLVLVYMAFSQRRLKANVQRIREEFGEPTTSVMPPLGAAEPPDEPPIQAPGANVIGELDAKIAQAAQLVARLESAIARAERLGTGNPTGGPKPD